MQPLLPDSFTALGMTAAAACAVAWLMVVLGQAYWRKGLSLAVASTVLYGIACACAALYIQRPTLSLQLLTAWAFSASISALTLAIQVFRYSRHVRRDIATVLLPLGATSLLHAGLIPLDAPLHSALQSSIYAVQTLFALTLLLCMRSSTPGSGWQWFTAALTLQCGGYLAAIAHALSPEMMDLRPAGIQWVMQLLPMGQLIVASVGFVVMLRDRESGLEWSKSQLDPLTQLPNRAALVQHLRNLIEQSAQHQQSMAIMVLDIDHFKSVNDSYGHLVGDQVIQSIAHTLKQQARSSDLAARYGGEEFVVALSNTNARDALHIAERLCQAVRKLSMPLPNGKMLHTTISIGVYAGSPTHGSSWERLVGAADEAMYRAKNNGRDRVFMSGPVQAMQSPIPTAEFQRL